MFVLLLVTIILGMQGCASNSASQTTPAITTDSAGANENTSAAQSDNPTDSTDSPSTITQAIEPEGPPTIVESCKDEAYNKYESQSRDSISKGLAATKAEKYGVGFRNIEEHNKWSKIHSSLFKSVNDACTSLSSCAKQHPKDKATACVEEAKTFRTWQNLAKNFAREAKTVETTQPPKICSQPPSLEDEARCFHGLGDNIDSVCNSEECKDVSNCWRDVGYLDTVIKQATQACSFVHQDLQHCHSYVEETTRRKNKFAQCQELQDKISITLFPVL